jgi:hypothetical protein
LASNEGRGTPQLVSSNSDFNRWAAWKTLWNIYCIVSDPSQTQTCSQFHLKKWMGYGTGNDPGPHYANMPSLYAQDHLCMAEVTSYKR